MPPKKSKLFASAPRAELLAAAREQAVPKAPRRRRTANGAAPAKRESVVAVDQRLAYRPKEFAEMTGVSLATVWRGIRDGRISTVDHLGIRVIPRRVAIAAGFIDGGNT